MVRAKWKPLRCPDLEFGCFRFCVLRLARCQFLAGVAQLFKC